MTEEDERRKLYQIIIKGKLAVILYVNSISPTPTMWDMFDSDEVTLNNLMEISDAADMFMSIEFEEKEKSDDE